MAITRWEPFRELVSLRQAMDRLFDESFVRPVRSWVGVEESALDMYQIPDEVVIKASLPGVKPEDVHIIITGNSVTIKGETKAERRSSERITSTRRGVMAPLAAR